MLDDDDAAGPIRNPLGWSIAAMRESVGLTQQEVSNLAGEPCRTFIAHLEQGIRPRPNLEKLYHLLHVLFKAEGRPVMSEITLEMFEALVLKVASLEEYVRSKPVEPEPTPTPVLRPARYEGPTYRHSVTQMLLERGPEVRTHFKDIYQYLIDHKMSLMNVDGLPISKAEAISSFLSGVSKEPEDPFVRGMRGTYAVNSRCMAALETSLKKQLADAEAWQVKRDTPIVLHSVPSAGSGALPPPGIQPIAIKVALGLSVAETLEEERTFPAEGGDGGWIHFAHDYIHTLEGECGRRIMHEHLKVRCKKEGPTMPYRELVERWITHQHNKGRLVVTKRGDESFFTRVSKAS